MTQTPKRSRRLRKKLFVDEFAVKGFGFSCSVNTNNEQELDQFFDGLLDLVESRNLQIGGGGNEGTFEGYVSSAKRYGSATEEDKSALTDWLAAQANVTDVNIEALTDAYYD
ncbi:YggL family protein [Litoribacillus peritrichatus]|uniref:50S ribosome-binding protein YggL n=1 Tax=Litoribacillus peritrichatus TaxID=718191 RepID=A0ABP7N0I1_9GAMM